MKRFALCIGTLLACGTSTTGTPDAGPPPVASQRGVQTAQAPTLADANLPVAVSPHAEYGENEFTESDRSRDPFRSFALMFVEDKGKQRQGPQVTVLLGQYSIDELKLVAIQTGGDYARAQLIDPTTKGWTVKKGDYIGRPDVVHVGTGSSGTDYQLNWRIDRIRDGDIVLTREDPLQPQVPPATRIIPLHPEAEQQQQNAPL
jgi:type IV pilus assembly protein PilP